MASGTLYTYPGSFRANKILIAAAYSGASVTVADFEYGKTNTSAEFLKKFPLGKVPAFESNDVYLNESDAIAQYVSNDALLGGNCAANQAAVREYISFTENEIVPSACTWVFPTLGLKQYNKQDTDNAITHLKKCFTKLNNDLLTRTFLVGERVTLADITLCTSLAMLYVQVLDGKTRESFGNLNRWFMTCINQPNFKKSLGDIKLCEKMATFDGKRYQELHPKGGKDKKESKNKESKPKAEAKVKDEKPQPAAEPEKPKKIDYFKDWKKSDKFNFDDWKTEYANKELDVSFKWFEEHFDTSAYTVWQCEYKYKDFNQVFLAMNLVGGFTQRIEGLRKHTHGIMIVLPKTDEDGSKYFAIKGLWIQKGEKLVFDLCSDWNVDAPSFDFRKIGTDEINKYVRCYFGGTDENGVEFGNNFDEFR